MTKVGATSNTLLTQDTLVSSNMSSSLPSTVQPVAASLNSDLFRRRQRTITPYRRSNTTSKSRENISKMGDSETFTSTSNINYLTSNKNSIEVSCTVVSSKRRQQQRGSGRGKRRPRARRALLHSLVRPLKSWLLRNRRHPYPSRNEKQVLAQQSNLSLVQVSNWFANARRRLKNVVQEPNCSWSKRLRCYNKLVQGNAERISIDDDDSIWDEEEHHQQQLHEEEDVDVEGLSDEEHEKHGVAEVGLGDQEDEAHRESTTSTKLRLLQRYLADSQAVNSSLNTSFQPFLADSKTDLSTMSTIDSSLNTITGTMNSAMSSKLTNTNAMSNAIATNPIWPLLPMYPLLLATRAQSGNTESSGHF